MAHIKGKKKEPKYKFVPTGMDFPKECTEHAASFDQTDSEHPYKCFHCGIPMTEEDYENFFKKHGYRLQKKTFAKKWDYRKVGKPMKSFSELLEGY